MNLLYLLPSTVPDLVAREAQSALPDAPVVPDEEPRPRRTLLSRLRRDARGRHAAAVVCEAEGRDRSAKVAGAAGAC